MTNLIKQKKWEETVDVKQLDPLSYTLHRHANKTLLVISKVKHKLKGILF